MKISQLQIVTGFQQDNAVLLSCGPALKALEGKLRGQLFTINAPEDAPASLPRAVLKLEDTIFNLALDRLQVTTRPPAHVADDLSHAMQFARQRTLPFIEGFIDVIPAYQWTGIIVEIEFPENPMRSNSAAEAAIPVFDRLVKIDRRSLELSSFQLKFAVKDADYFVGYSIQAYEGRQLNIAVPPGAKVVVDPKDFPLSEVGVEVVVDINNKSAVSSSDPIGDVNIILDKQINVIRELKSYLNLEGLVK